MKNFMNKATKSPAFYVLIYLPVMAFTYILPYFGSNSLMAAALVDSAKHIPKDAGFTITASQPSLAPYTMLHLLCLSLLVGLAFYRGKFIQKNWLWVVALMAAIFDMMPVLSLIPFVPTLLHLATLGFGVFLTRETQEQKI